MTEWTQLLLVSLTMIITNLASSPIAYDIFTSLNVKEKAITFFSNNSYIDVEDIINFDFNDTSDIGFSSPINSKLAEYLMASAYPYVVELRVLGTTINDPSLVKLASNKKYIFKYNRELNTLEVITKND